MLIVDTGVLLAAADEADPDHAACAKLVEDDPGPLVTTPLVIAETAYLIGRQLGPTAEAGFFRSLADSEITVEELGAGRLTSMPSNWFRSRPSRNQHGNVAPALR